MANKITKKEMFERVKGELKTQELIDFIDKQIELTIKKNKGTKKPTKTQIANEGLKEVVMSVLDNEPKSVSDIQLANDSLKDLSNQKVSSLLASLVRDNKIVRTTIKKKSHFARV